MKNYLKLLHLAAAALLVASLGTSCGTIRGMGHDVEHAGNSIQRVGH